MPDPAVTVLRGDARHLPLGDNSVDAIVTDPPYGIGFMGKEWDSGKSFVERKAAKGNTFDHVGGNHNPTSSADAARTRRVEAQRFGVWCAEWAAEAYRVMKPGAFLLAFGGTRTFHRLAVAIEDAGFEIRDSIGHGHAVPVMAWVQSQGFPKSLDIGKAIDRAAGAEREVIGTKRSGLAMNDQLNDDNWRNAGTGELGKTVNVTAPATDDARRWQGWGTALRPAWEPIVVARKPLAAGTVAANVLTHGCGGINIDATRVTATSPGGARSSRGGSTGYTSPWRAAARTIRNARTLPPVSSAVLHGADSGRLASALAHALDPTSAPSSQGDYPSCRGCDDGRARLAAEAAQDAVPSPNDAREPRDPRWIARRIRANQCDDHPSSWGDLARLVEAADAVSAAHLPPGNGNSNVEGRWPSNVVFSHPPLVDGDGRVVGDACDPVCVDGCPVAELDAQSGITRDGVAVNRNRSGYRPHSVYGDARVPTEDVGYGGSGGASRYYPVFRYQAKAPSKERPKVNGVAHNTVKPLTLMRWLVRLVVPPGGLVLDPFAGSGTTVEAAVLEGFNAVGVEFEATYLPLIQARIDRAAQSVARAAEPQPVGGQLAGQTDLLAGLAGIA